MPALRRTYLPALGRQYVPTGAGRGLGQGNASSLLHPISSYTGWGLKSRRTKPICLIVES